MHARLLISCLVAAMACGGRQEAPPAHKARETRWPPPDLTLRAPRPEPQPQAPEGAQAAEGQGAAQRREEPAGPPSADGARANAATLRALLASKPKQVRRRSGELFSMGLILGPALWKRLESKDPELGKTGVRTPLVIMNDEQGGQVTHVARAFRGPPAKADPGQTLATLLESKTFFAFLKRFRSGGLGPPTAQEVTFYRLLDQEPRPADRLVVVARGSERLMAAFDPEHRILFLELVSGWEQLPQAVPTP